MYQVICGFPGVGKTKALEHYPSLVDLDVPGKTDYIETIKELNAQGKVVLVPSWQSLRDELVAAGIHFLLVYPDTKLKRTFMHRYKTRGSPEKMVNTMYEKWDEFVLSCENQRGCDHHVIGARGIYLVDLLREYRWHK